MKRRTLIQMAATAGGSLTFGAAHSQSGWPNRPIRLIVPYAAGLSIDVAARILAEQVGRSLGQPMVVDNRPGAAGIIGTDAAAKSAPDGYTVMMSVTAAMSMNPNFYSKLPYDTFKDFAAVTQTSNLTFVLVTGANQPYRTIADLVAVAKAKPGSIDYGSLGVGSAQHVLMELLSSTTSTRFTHVPYKSSLMPDLLAGIVPVAFEPSTTTVPLIRQGKLRGLGITGTERLPALPDVPTIKETVPDFEGDTWHGIFVPAGTPSPIVARLADEFNKAVRVPEVSQRLSEVGLFPAGTSPQAFDKLWRDDAQKWGRLARTNNIRVE